MKELFGYCVLILYVGRVRLLDLRKPARFLQRTQKMRPFAPQVN